MTNKTLIIMAIDSRISVLKALIESHQKDIEKCEGQRNDPKFVQLFVEVDYSRHQGYKQACEHHLEEMQRMKGMFEK